MEKSVLSPLQTQKFTTLFQYFDTDRDGVLSAADFRAQAQRITTSFGWSENEKLAKQVTENRSALFERLLSGADKDKNGSVTLAEFLRYFERQILAYRAAQVVSPWLMQSCKDVLELIDQDRSGAITADEYARLLAAMGSDADAHAAFAKIDTDGDGKLLLKDIVALSVEFMMSEDPEAAGNFFFCGKV
ncbi:MAG TPA: EF-hand domain-containing protein [Pseudomonadota bacterium]|jgi:Ca2+-binding EF-hand superfamily protein|nr:EF-hand domain-containing protein [Pseudomonadota bacterium]